MKISINGKHKQIYLTFQYKHTDKTIKHWSKGKKSKIKSAESKYVYA